MLKKKRLPELLTRPLILWAILRIFSKFSVVWAVRGASRSSNTSNTWSSPEITMVLEFLENEKKNNLFKQYNIVFYRWTDKNLIVSGTTWRCRQVPEDNEINDDRQFGKPIMEQWKRKTKRYNITITCRRRNGLKSNVKIVNDTDADSDDGCDTTVWQTARPIRPDCQNNEAALVQRYIGTIYDTVARARLCVYRMIN